ncbi:MAG: redoxin family protein [Phycisphaerales bacterium]
MNARLFRTALLAAAGLAMSASLVVAEPPADAPAKPADATKQPAETTKPVAKAEDKALKAGQKAPALSLDKTVKGDAVTGFEKGRFYVVEFWATWCGPCKTSIPHLTKLQKDYKSKGVTFIGISDEDEPTVAPFVKEQGDKMDYVVAIDKDRTTNKAWMEAAGQNGIPTAFIVNKDGNIAWIGHPMSMDKVLDSVVAGTFDIAKHAEQQAKMELMQKDIGKALRAKDWDKAFKSMDELSALDSSMAGQIGATKFQILLMAKKDYAAAYKQANALADGPIKDDAQTLNQIAWTILDAPGLETRDFDTAMKLAARAAEVTKNQDGAILDTLARAYWEKGDKAKAVEIQTKAVALTKGLPDQVKDEMEANLKRYQTETPAKK